MEISSRAIDISTVYLRGLDKSSAMRKWAFENKTTLEKHLDGYDEIVARMNDISADSQLLECMPKTRRLKKALSGQNIPLLEGMSQGNFGLGLIEARKPMLHGQRIKKNEISEVTADDKIFAIGTPSMNTSIEALVIGTAGHLAERTFFQWARKNKLQPEEGWIKDDYLQALDEGLMLLIVEGKKPHLASFFINSNSDGGLGWLNQQKLDAFRQKITSI